MGVRTTRVLPASRVAGVVPITVLDFPGHVAASIFLPGCNFRCPFCHNPELVVGPFPEAMSMDGLGLWLGQRSRFLDGICISGGEPLLVPGRVMRLCRLARELGLAVKLDTNGSFPGPLAALLDAGLLDYVAVDIKAAPSRYAEAIGREPPLRRIESSVALLRAAGVRHELRTTVSARLHTPRDIEAIGQWIGGSSTYVMQPFRPAGTLAEDWQQEESPSPEVLASLAERARVHFDRLIINL